MQRVHLNFQAVLAIDCKAFKLQAFDLRKLSGKLHQKRTGEYVLRCVCWISKRIFVLFPCACLNLMIKCWIISLKTGGVVSERFSEWSLFVDSSVLRGVIFPDAIDGSLGVSCCQGLHCVVQSKFGWFAFFCMLSRCERKMLNGTSSFKCCAVSSPTDMRKHFLFTSIEWMQ